MFQGLNQLLLACGAFVGSHFILSGPLRAPLARRLGEPVFAALYSLIALAALVWVAVAFDRAGRGPGLWDGTAVLPWLVASVLTYAATAFLIGSLAGNPALPQANLAGLSTRKPWGAFRVTRHPMMFAISLWAAAHLVVAPTARSAILSLSMILLALGGAALQDRRKLERNGREWGVWMQRTRFWPRLSQLGALGTTWIVALAAWLLATLLHLYLAHVPAGVWLWVR